MDTTFAELLVDWPWWVRLMIMMVWGVGQVARQLPALLQPWWRDRAERGRLDFARGLVDAHGPGVLSVLPDVLDAARGDEPTDEDEPPGRAVGGG
ncbi:hypothetical protein ACFFX1_11030 [Dactylosporangium sucinum]|uniref:Uncharacterized protein n=1 Tax=Dactylosporangium sucinum TaxID=1424081 RepID=A0A917TGM8_9ACTN|nr:hypothetical protein [Dactylosporangium sucinum]GGM22605.1 hypothetical protein GCM10007977_024710 [Dactylosporangium sucinum]